MSFVQFIPPEKPTQTVRVVLKNGFWFDFLADEQFNLTTYVSTIRACGYILNVSLYVPLTEIQAIFMYPTNAPPKEQGVVVPFDHKVH